MKYIHYAKQIVYGSEETLMFTHEMSLRYKDTPGVFCECGVAAGAHVIVMAGACPNKTIYAFDSFQGIALPSNRDNQYPGIRMISEAEQLTLPNPGEQVLESSGATVVSVESFIDHTFNALGKASLNIRIYKGWFEETMLDLPDSLEDISILRLDADLFHSTWVCLQHLFPKVVKGGCVIVDDWTLPGCRAACDEYFSLIGYEPEYKFLSTIAYFYK